MLRAHMSKGRNRRSTVLLERRQGRGLLRRINLGQRSAQRGDLRERHGAERGVDVSGGYGRDRRIGTDGRASREAVGEDVTDVRARIIELINEVLRRQLSGRKWRWNHNICFCLGAGDCLPTGSATDSEFVKSRIEIHSPQDIAGSLTGSGLGGIEDGLIKE